VLSTRGGWIAGGTIINVLEDIVSRGGDPSNIIVVCVVACPPALKKLSEKFVGKSEHVALAVLCLQVAVMHASM